MGKNHSKKEDNHLNWWQLSLIGVGSTIGTGYFLGSGIAIQMTGFSVIIAFVLAAFATYMVYNVLARMTVNDPQKGSFRSYAKKAYGRWAGFSTGWVYWCSEMLIIGSQMTALSIFSRFWFPHVPLWLFASGYAVLGIGVVLTGNKGFDRLENVFAVTKVAAILMFLIIAVVAFLGLLGDGRTDNKLMHNMNPIFPRGTIGLWSSLIYAFYAFGGIEIMGLMAFRLRKKKDAPKSGRIMLWLLAIIYVLSISLALTLVSWDSFNTKESPFIISLQNYDLPFFPHIFNGALIIAGFSTMAASLFSVTTILVTLAEEGDAPAFFAKKGKLKLKVPLNAMSLTTIAVIVSIVFSFLMPGKIYEYVTTAAGLMLLYNWFFILISSFRLIQLTHWDKIKGVIAAVLILLAVSGTLLQADSRPGFYVSLLFLTVIGLLVIKMRLVWKSEKG